MKQLKSTPSWLGSAVIFLIGIVVSPLRAENLLALGYGEGLPGSSNVAVAVTARHDLPLHGFSLSLAYPRDALQLRDIKIQGTMTEQVGVDFHQKILDEAAGTGILGVIFTLQEPAEPTEPAQLPPTGPDDLSQLLAWLYFDVPPNAPPGLHRIELVDGLGNPPVSNRFTHRGTTIRPGTEQGSFMVYSENVITMDSRFTFPGFRADPVFAYARHPEPLQGFQLAVSFDPRALVLEEVTPSGTTLFMTLGMSGMEFLQINWLPEDIEVSPTEYRTTAGVIFDYLAPFDGQVLPPETGSTTRQSIMKYTFQPTVNADQYGESIPLIFSDSQAPDAVNNVFIIDSKSYFPEKIHGRIYFSRGNLTGLVKDYTSSQPVFGATVALEPGGLTTTTGSDGSFLFQEIPPGAYSALITRSGFFPVRIYGDVAGKGDTSDLGEIRMFAKPLAVHQFRRTEVNGDGSIDLSDVISILGILFLGKPARFNCLDAMDMNDDGKMDISDPIFFLDYLFTGGRAPPPPFESCGTDPTPDEMGCEEFPLCQGL